MRFDLQGYLDKYSSYVDILAPPLYNNGTKVGFFGSIAAFLFWCWYTIQVIYESSSAITTTTTVKPTAFDSNTSFVSFDFTCPGLESLSDPLYWSTFDFSNPINYANSTYFTHCFIYSPSCKNIKINSNAKVLSSIVYIAAGKTETVSLCNEKAIFYSGVAIGVDSKIECSGAPVENSHPLWPIAGYSYLTTPKIGLLEYNDGFMNPFSESYTYIQILKSDLGGKVDDQSFMSSSGQLSEISNFNSFGALVENLCSGSFNTSNFTGTFYSPPPGIYGFAAISYSTKTTNNLRSGYLTVLGSVGGAFSGIFGLAGLFYMIYLMIYPAIPIHYVNFGINTPKAYKAPKKHSKVPWYHLYDIFANPISTNGTAIGAGMSISLLAGAFIYVFFLFWQARDSTITATNVLVTAKNSTVVKVDWNVTCPSVMKNPVDPTQSFTHCLFYQPYCTGYEIQSIKASEVGIVKTCLQKSLFYASAAMLDGNQIQCTGNMSSYSGLFPLLNFAYTLDETGIVGFNFPTVAQLGKMTPNAVFTYMGKVDVNIDGEKYSEDTVDLVKNTQAMPMKLPDLKQEAAELTKLLLKTKICSNEYNIFDNSVIYYSYYHQYVSIMPDPYRYSPQYFSTSSQNFLRTNWLSLIGSASGSFSGLMGLCALIYSYLLLSNPSAPLNPVTLGFVPKEMEALNKNHAPPIKEKLDWMYDYDLLRKPVYFNGTLIGAIISIAALIGYLIYAIFSFVQAGDTVITTTEVGYTKKIDTVTTAIFTFNCPAASELQFGEQNFPNCFIYSPNCTALGTTVGIKGLKIVPAGSTTVVNMCIQKNPFFSGMAAKEDGSLSCKGTNNDITTFANSDKTVLSVPFAPWNMLKKSGSWSELDDDSGEMDPNRESGGSYYGESYSFLRTVDKKLSGPPIIFDYLSSREIAPVIQKKNLAAIMEPFAKKICKTQDFFNLTELYTGIIDPTQVYSSDSSSSAVRVMLAAYSFSSIYFVQTNANVLGQNWLNTLGSIGGMWGTIAFLCTQIYILLKVKFPAEPLDLQQINIIPADPNPIVEKPEGILQSVSIPSPTTGEIRESKRGSKLGPK